MAMLRSLLATLAVGLWLYQQRGWAIVALMAAALTKDTFILFAVVLALAELRQGSWRTALVVLVIPSLPLALWAGWVHTLFQQDVAQGAFNFAVPGLGLVRAYPTWLGLPGAALAESLTGLILVVAGYAQLAWEGRNPAWHHHVLRPLLAALAMVPICLALVDVHLGLAVLGGAATYFVVLFLLGGLRREDLAVMLRRD